MLMIKRHALVIECSEIVGQDKLPGAQRDAIAWREFLLSDRGGAWRRDEITVLNNPTRQNVLSRLGLMNEGYGFVTFSGHGFVSGATNETMACLQGGNISEFELTPACPRATVVLDSCRGVLAVTFAEALTALHKRAADNTRYRDLFDTALEIAEKGACTLYGCAFEQAAQESSAGGDFTQALIRAGENWAGPGVFSLRNAFDQAEKVVRGKSKQQTPVSKLGRRLYHFPFAVEP